MSAYLSNLKGSRKLPNPRCHFHGPVTLCKIFPGRIILDKTASPWQRTCGPTVLRFLVALVGEKASSLGRSQLPGEGPVPWGGASSLGRRQLPGEGPGQRGRPDCVTALSCRARLRLRAAPPEGVERSRETPWGWHRWVGESGRRRGGGSRQSDHLSLGFSKADLRRECVRFTLYEIAGNTVGAVRPERGVVMNRVPQ